MTSQSRSEYERFTGDSAENYERHFTPSIGEPIARQLIEAARPVPGERVLDVACGTGIVARLVAEAVGPQGQVAGLDVNPGMLAVARTVGPETIEWHEASAENLPLPDRSFDLVVSSMGLQFVPDRAAAVREMRRVLVPGGRAVWCTPGPTPPLMEAIDQALSHHVGPGASMFVHAVFSLCDPAEARALLEEGGFDDVDVTHEPVPLRVPLPADFFWQYVHSTPLATVLAEVDDATRTALEQEVVERCQPFVDGDASVIAPGLLIATGYRRDG